MEIKEQIKTKEIKEKTKEITLILSGKELEDLQHDLYFVVYMREVKLSETGQKIYDIK